MALSEKEKDFVVNFNKKVGDLIKEHALLWKGELSPDNIFIGMAASLDSHSGSLLKVVIEETKKGEYHDTRYTDR